MSQLHDDIPGNSFKEQEKRKKEAEESVNEENKKPEVTPFDGQVSQAKRKGKFWPWFRKMFLSDRKPKDILMGIVNDQIVPNIKDNFRNSVVSTVDGFIYQNSTPPNASHSNNSIVYNNIYRTQPNKPQKETKPQSEVDTEKGFSNPCFKTRAEAERFLNQKLKAYDYPTLSVHTLYMMQNRRIDFTWDAYGWNREEIVTWDSSKIIVHINSSEWPWMINLPQAHVIS